MLVEIIAVSGTTITVYENGAFHFGSHFFHKAILGLRCYFESYGAPTLCFRQAPLDVLHLAFYGKEV